MSTEHIITICTIIGLAGAGIGSLLTVGIQWGVSKTRLGELSQGQISLRGDFDSHQKDNSRHVDPESYQTLRSRFYSHEKDSAVHVDPIRDPQLASAATLELAANVKHIKEQVEVLNVRCEKRGRECGDHFGKIESHMARENGIREGKAKMGEKT